MLKQKEDILGVLKRYKKPVWSIIQKYLEEPRYTHPFQIETKHRKESTPHWQMLREYPERQGKYLRPALLLLTCGALGVDKRKALQTAAAIQISEDWLLIHDDVEDQSFQRRGKPTLHRIYGDELAINAGDAIHMIMWKILIDNRKYLSEEKTLAILNEFYSILSRTALGQSVEIRWSKENKTNFSDQDWFFICDGKTSYYTVAGPMRMAALIAGIKDKKKLQKISEFALSLGRCFQIIDDILDLTSDFAGFKKQTGNDLYEGKRTIILGHLLRTAGKKDREKLIRILGKMRHEKKDPEIKWILAKIDEYKSIEYAKELALKLKDRALRVFDKDLKFLSEEPFRSNLRELINFVLERSH